MEKFIAYEKAREANKKVVEFLRKYKVDKYKWDQLHRASNSMVLNIAEGNGRYSKPDKMHFFVIARGSAKEVLALYDLLEDEGIVNQEVLKTSRKPLVEVIKILSSIIGNSLKSKKQK